MDVAADLIPLLGLPPDASTAERLAALVGGGPRDDLTHGPVLYWIWKTAGISFLFKSDTMDDIQLYMIPPPEYGAFLGRLPSGLALAPRRREVRAALGPPARVGESQPIYCDDDDYHDGERHIIGYTNHWDRYVYSDYEILFPYDWAGDPGTGYPLGRAAWEGDADELRPKLIYLSRPGSVPWYPSREED